MNILILNGPNLNMLGQREPDIYGNQTLQDIENMCQKEFPDNILTFHQSNHEGELVTWIQEAMNKYHGLIINAGAYTHTSIAIHDALKLLDYPVIEVHLSNPSSREAFRHNSYITPVADKVITGQGAQGYIMAIDYLQSSF